MSSVQWPRSSHRWPLELLVKLLRHCTTRPVPDRGVAVKSASPLSIFFIMLLLWAVSSCGLLSRFHSHFLEKYSNSLNSQAHWTFSLLLLLLLSIQPVRRSYPDQISVKIGKKEKKISKSLRKLDLWTSGCVYISNTEYTVCTPECNWEQSHTKPD